MTDDKPTRADDRADPDAGDLTVDAPLDGRGDTSPDTPQDAAPFDAIAAAAELSAAMSGQADDDDDDSVAGPGGADRYIAILESEVEQLGAIVAQRERQLRAAEERADAAREDVAQAEIRLQRAADKALEQRTRALLVEMLDVVDDLDRAIEAAKQRQGGTPSELLVGVELVHRRFLAGLRNRGISEIAAEGELFDANLHDAVSMVAARDAQQDGRVIAVTRRGYHIGAEVLRPAGVVVAKKA